MEISATPARRPAGLEQIVAVGLLPWLAAWLGSYALHSAVAAFLFYHLLCLSAAGLYRHRYGPVERRFASRRDWIALGIAAGAIMAAVYFMVGALGVFGWLIDPVHIRAALAAQRIPARPMDYAALFLYFAAINPIAEELFWRGTIYPGLRRAGANIPRSTLVSSLLFGSWHWLIVRLFFAPIWSILITLGIVAAGVVFAMVFERVRSITFSILVHALAADIPILLVLWFGVLAKR